MDRPRPIRGRARTGLRPRPTAKASRGPTLGHGHRLGPHRPPKRDELGAWFQIRRSAKQGQALARSQRRDPTTHPDNRRLGKSELPGPSQSAGPARSGTTQFPIVPPGHRAGHVLDEVARRGSKNGSHKALRDRSLHPVHRARWFFPRPGRGWHCETATSRLQKSCQGMARSSHLRAAAGHPIPRGSPDGQMAHGARRLGSGRPAPRRHRKPGPRPPDDPQTNGRNRPRRAPSPHPPGTRHRSRRPGPGPGPRPVSISTRPPRDRDDRGNRRPGAEPRGGPTRTPR